MNMISKIHSRLLTLNVCTINIKNLFKSLLTTIFIVNLIFCFIILSIKFTLFFKPLYYIDIGYLNIVEASKLTEKEIKDNYNYILTYLTQSTDEEFNLPTLPSSAKGKIHFKEVKILFERLNKILFFSMIISIIGVIYKNRNKKIRYLLISSISLLIIPILLLIPFLINFDKSFTTFHHIFFKNDYWLFNINSDPIITILPQEYFFHCAMLIITFIFVISMILGVIYKASSKNNK